MIAGSIVFFIIFFLRPFGFDQVPENLILFHAFLYGFVTLVTAAANLFILPTLFSKLFDETSWTVGREFLMMVWQIVTISSVNVALTHTLYGYPLSPTTFLVFLGYTSAVGIFPIGILVLLKYISLLKKYQHTAQSIEQNIFENEATEPLNNQTIRLTGDYQNELLEVKANDLLYIATADNYIQVFYQKESSVKSAFLRSTLKKAEESLSNSPQFFRCHRTYLVNLQKIEHISGNAQGLKLQLKDTTQLIPVSRSLNQELKNQTLRHKPLRQAL
ncbi:MAG: LytTR family transcriptional regulator [Sphingobacteriaceae bacterium]|nr:LytTR family transcriptional regulator [Sphingobacteriaceae bacterium]